MSGTNLKEDIIKKARSLGAEIVKVCSVDSWENEPIQSPEFWPKNIWPWSKSVIVLIIPLFLPMAATAPSMLYQEQYTVSNRITDDIAYNLSRYIMTEKHHRAFFFPRDCYYNLSVLLKNPSAAFSHVLAGYYAGAGSIGASHNLITKEFGPRIRIVSVITDADLPPDEKTKEDLCLHCKKCMNICPAGCFSCDSDSLYDMDKIKCTQHHLDLMAEHHWPCGYCATFCPVGDDLKMYKDTEIVTKSGTAHCQKYGS